MHRYLRIRPALAAWLLVILCVECRPAAAQIRGHWRLQETAGTMAVDTSSYASNGTYTNGVTLASSTPAPNDGAIAASFDGVNDYVAIPNEANYDLTGAITVACWIKVDVFDTSFQAIVTKGNTAWRIQREGATNFLEFACTGLTPFKVVSVTSVNDGQWHHVAGVYTGSQLQIYIDGQLDNSVASTGAISTNAAPVEIGRNFEAAGREFDGAIYNVVVYNGALQGSEIQAIFNWDALTAHWKLDQTSGTTAIDSTILPNDGTYANGVLLGGAGPYPGTGNLAATFDATNDHVTTANEYLYDLRGPITVAAWIKVNAFTVASQAIVTKGNSAWRLQRNGSTNQVQFACNGLTDTSVVSTTNVNDGRWHHVVGIYNGSSLHMYVDGVLEASDASTGAIGITAHNVYIGENAQSAGRYWNGAIHDVRIYSVALSAAQVAKLYGLVGHWKLGETAGTTASDATANAAHGTVQGAANWLTTCSGTGGFDFDGSANYVSVSSSAHLQPTSALTISAWVKGDAWGAGADVDTILRKGEAGPNNYALSISDGRVELLLDASDGGGVRGGTILSTGQWHHVAAVWDGATVRIYVDGVLDNAPPARSGTIGTDARTLYLGGYSGSDRFDGMMHDVRLYNRALSQADIAQLAATVGYWTFAEGTGSTAADSSPLANHATLLGGATWTTDCSGNYALLTNGTGAIAQTASVFTPPDVGTVAFWMRSTGVPATTSRIMGLGGDWEVRQNPDGRVISDLCGDGATIIGTTTALNDVGRWYHFAATFDSSNDTYALYVDGLLENAGMNLVAMSQQAAAVLSFGTRTGSTEYWNGALRDFRVYRRKLCPGEIAELHGLVGHWKLDELAGTTASDATLFGNNATYQNSPSLGMNSPVDYGVQFNGTNYAITNQTMSPPSTGTVAFWMKRDGAPAGRERFLGVNGNWEIWQDPDGLVRCDLGGDGLVGGFQSVTQMTIHNKWYHFAATFDAVTDTFAIYIDGVLDASGSMALAQQPAGQLTHAGRTGHSIERFQGSLDDVRIYNRVLCPAEVAKLHAGGDFEGVRIIKWVEIQ